MDHIYLQIMRLAKYKTRKSGIKVCGRDWAQLPSFTAHELEWACEAW